MFKSERVHVYIAMALFLSMAGGGYLLAIDLGGASLYALRGVCILAGLYYLFRNRIASFWGSPVANSYFLLIAVTIGYGVLALSWSENLMSGVKELTNIAFGYAIYFVLRNVSAGITGKENMVPYFVWGMVALLLMASTEIYLQIHFPSSYNTKLQELWPGHFAYHAPAATYGNPNNLAVLLSGAIFVFVYILLRKKEKIGYAILICWTLAALWFTESRFSLLGVYLLIPFGVYFYRREWISFVKSRAVFVALFVATVALTIVGAQFTKTNLAQVPPPVEIEIPSTEEEPMGSSAIRYNLMLNALEFAKESNLRGIGPGQFPVQMTAQQGKYKTHEIVNPHAGGLEILSEYGIGVLSAWGAWWIFLFVLLLRNIRQKPVAVPLLMLLALLPISMANSSFLNSPSCWIYIALLLWTGDHALAQNGTSETHPEPVTPQ